MEKHSRAYEQYCWVVGHNVIIEDVTQDSRERILHCTNLHNCETVDGCKNRVILEQQGQIK